MKIQEQQVVIIKNNINTFESFAQQAGIMAMPKREVFTMIDSGRVGGRFDIRVSPDKRHESNYAAASRWATHSALMGLFIKSDYEWLLIIEDSCAVPLSLLETIEVSVKPGLNMFSDTATIYVVDRLTAKSIVKNTSMFYAPYETMLDDMEKLNLITVHRTPIVSKFTTYTYMYSYIPLMCGIFLALFLFFMLCPYDRFFTKNGISLTKMFGPEEAVVSGKG
jgi:hypothetical protein